MKVLILTGSFGMGHNSTALSIKEEIARQYNGAEIQILDIIDYCFPRMKGLIYGSFKLLVQKCPRIYNMSYKLTEKRSDVGIEKIVLKKIETMIYAYKPDVIISTIPFAADSISYYKEKKKNLIPHITCITDISIHSEWITKNSDMYFVGSKDTKEYLCRNGISENNIFITGIPVKNDFKENGLNYMQSHKKKKVLIMGGGFGLIPLHDNILSKLENLSNVETTVITGNNKKLYNEILLKYPSVNLVGYTNKVSEYMKDADILISKPGGITLFEAIQSTLPILVIDPFLAQEKCNAHYIEEKNIGKVIWNKKNDSFIEILDFICDDNLQRTMRNQMYNIKCEINKVEMATLIGGLCERQAV